MINKAMTYNADIMQVDKSGTLDRPEDWDSLSDRMRKLRKPHQKAILQQHKDVTVLADRKDALTKRPLDFDREEETRKGETIKWLESHFGSESTASNESRDDDTETEPAKRTYFNVTIKSNPVPSIPLGDAHRCDTIIVNEKYNKEHTGFAKDTCWRGISNRNDIPLNHFASKAFRDDLQEAVEKNRVRNSSLLLSRQSKDNERFTVDPIAISISKENIQQKSQSLSSQYLEKTQENSHNSIDESPTRDNIRNMNGLISNLCSGLNIQEDINKDNNEKRNDDVQTSDQQEYISDATINFEQELEVIHDNNKSILFKTVTTTPPLESTHSYLSATTDRPIVLQHKRSTEKNLTQQSNVSRFSPVPLDHHNNFTEPPPDYSTCPRSRSTSPNVDNKVSNHRNEFACFQNVANANTLAKKSNQRTRFAPTETFSAFYNSQPQSRLLTASQTTQTTPSSISTSTIASHKSITVGQVIGNSFRKFIKKIRSVSADRKLRVKSKSKSVPQSPGLSTTAQHDNTNILNSTTSYQQYNVIDSHIVGQHSGHQDDHLNVQQDHFMTQGRESIDLQHSENDIFPTDKDLIRLKSPRQRYYLGEDPYSSTLYGKQNIYDPGTPTNPMRDSDQDVASSILIKRTNRDQNNTMPQTLGRYKKSSQRLGASSPNLNLDYRTTQTLPRKINVHQRLTQVSGFTPRHNTLSHPETRTHHQKSKYVAGPIKPARTYAKTLNRSKSFNIHAINGDSNASPIYIEKVEKHVCLNNLHNSQAYKSNPYIYSGCAQGDSPLQSGLKSPSIVNLISRSQKDLNKIETNENISRNSRGLYTKNHGLNTINCVYTTNLTFKQA